MIKNELTIFLLVGSLTVLVDLLAYSALVGAELLGIDTSKAVSFMLGTVFAYLANRSWTFGRKVHASGSSFRFIMLYSVTLGANVFVNGLVLELFSGYVLVIDGAFLIATVVSAILNFIGMKWFVFKPSIN